MKTTKPTKWIRCEKWKVYSGMSAAFMAMASATQAQVIYTDVDPDSILSNSSFDIDFDGDGTVDLSLEHEEYSVGAYSSVSVLDAQASGSLIAPISYGDHFPSMLVAGFMIDPSDPDWSVVSGALLGRHIYGGIGGYWPGQTGFLGCRYVSGLGTTHYAWVQLSVDPLVESMTILGYAYEATPELGILAGDDGSTASVDELGGSTGLQVFPNPVRDRATLLIAEGLEGQVSLQVLDGIGRVMKRYEFATSTGVRTTELDLADLPAGTYLVSVRSGDRVMYRKLTKVD